MPVREVLKPANSPRQIILNVGANRANDPNDAYSELEFQAGFYFPIVKVRNTVFTKPAIITFDLNFGFDFLPTLNFVISDDNKSFQQTDYPVKNDIVTAYFGNQHDTVSKPILLDFRISEINTQMKTTGEVIHFFTCVLAVEKSFENKNIAESTDSIGVIQELCREMKLGFVTNIDQTNDKYKYRQYSKTNIDYLKFVCSRLYADDDQTVHYFIDQYYRLNVIDVNKVLYDSADVEEVHRDLTFFRPLETPEMMIFNNSQYNPENRQFKFNAYTPVNNTFDAYEKTKPIESMVVKKDYSTGKISSDFKSTKVQSKNERGKAKDITANNATNAKQVQSVSIDGEHNDNVQQLGNNANKTRFKYLNSNYLTIRMNTPSNLININKMIKVEVYTNDQYIQRPFKQSDKNLETSFEPLSPDGSERIDEVLSSDYSVSAMSFKYTRNGNLYQELKLIKRIWEKPKYNDDEEIDWSEATVGMPAEYTYPPPPPPPPLDSGGGYSYTGQLGNWMDIAKGEQGVREVEGSGSNPKIEEYHKVGGGLGAGTKDDVAWCGSFVGYCMVKAGYARAQSSASAKAWSTYGQPAPVGTYGAIVVLKLRPSSMTYSGYHVGFCAGMSDGIVSVLGGNQGNSVNIMKMSAGKVVAWRLPNGSPSNSISYGGNSVAPPIGSMRMSQNGIQFLKNREGCKLNSYQDSGGKWTIGYGHTKTARPNMQISYQQAEMLLRQDVVFFENYLNQNVKVKLTQSMFDALCSLIYNTGQGKASPSSDIGRLLAQRQYVAVSNVFLRYVTAKGKRLEGLVTRREQERQMFLAQGTNPV